MKIKSAARRSLGPIARPLLWRIRRFTGLRAEIDNFSVAWHQHVPALVNASASVAALAHEQARMKKEHDAALADLRARIEELRAGVQPAGSARVLAADKVRRARAEGARVVLGAAQPGEGWVRVDDRERPGVDIVSPLSALPFGAGELQELVASHVLGRHTQRELDSQLLPAWVRMIRPGGSFRAIALDAEAMIRAAGAGQLDFDQFRRALVDGSDGTEPLRNLFTPASLASALSAAGLVDVQVLAQGRPAAAGYEFEVAARVPVK